MQDSFKPRAFALGAVTLIIAIVLVTFYARTSPERDGRDAPIVIVPASGTPSDRPDATTRYAASPPDAAIGADELDAPTIEEALASASQEARDLHVQLKTREEDDLTARTEQRALSAIQAGVPVALRAQDLRKRCSSDACEISGSVAESRSTVIDSLSNPLWRDTLPRLGYDAGPIVTAERGGRTLFVVYLRRRR